MAEKLKNILAQKSTPRSYKESESVLMQKLALAAAQLKRGRKELKRLEDARKNYVGSVAAPDGGDNKRISELDNLFEPTFQNPALAKKRYEILKVTNETLELKSQLRKLRDIF